MALKDEEKKYSDQAFDGAVSMVQSQKPVYQDGFNSQIQDIYGKIANREKFSYDANLDPMYQQYKDKYVQQGKLAMKDTMGKAAGLTGGYGSSYGQAVGQQAYDAQLQKMGDVIPELYNMAYTRYQNEGDALQDQYKLLRDQQGEAYDRYRDQMADWNNDMTRAQQQEETAYNRGQQQYKIDLARAETLAAYGDFSGYAALYGDDQASGMKQTWINSNPDLAYSKGLLDEEQYYRLTGRYPTWYQNKLDAEAAAAAAAASYGGGYSGGSGAGNGSTEGVDDAFRAINTLPTKTQLASVDAAQKSGGISSSQASALKSKINQQATGRVNAVEEMWKRHS